MVKEQTMFIEGRCFICRKTENMDPEGYCHMECGIAYTEEKNKNRKFNRMVD